MYRKFILPLRIIVCRQSAFNGIKTNSAYFYHKSSLQVTAKYNCRLFSCESKGETETDPFSDEFFDDLFNESKVFSSNGNMRELKSENKLEKKRIEWEKRKPIIFEEISNGDPEILKNLKLLDLEVALLREQNYFVPSFLTKDNYEELLQLGGLAARHRFLKYLFMNEMKIINKCKNRAKKKEIKFKEFENNLENSAQIYSLGSNSLFLRFRNVTIRNIIHEKLHTASLYSPHIIFDCSYEHYMNSVELKNCASQIKHSFTANVLHPAPFHVKLCNFKNDCKLKKHLFKLCMSMQSGLHPWDFHEENYLDLYDHNRLVYLTPDSKTELKNFDPNDVYIIGAYVDKGRCVKASVAEATKYKLRKAKFPIDSYICWKQGSKSLTLNTVFQVLLDLRLHQNWNIAFERLPPRKIFKSMVEY